MRVFLVTVSLVLISGCCMCQEIERHCGVHPNLLRNGSGEPKMFSPEQLQSMATQKVQPEPVPLPSGSYYAGFVAANLMVDTRGDVICIWGAAGNPVMIPAAIRAMHGWKFKPMLVGTKPVKFVGRLRVPVLSVAR